MIEVWKLTKRHLNDPKDADKYKHISTFYKSLGHGVGTIDFSEKIAEFNSEIWSEILAHGDEYAKFKLGNIAKVHEIDIFPEHANELLKSISDTPLGEILTNLEEGYLTLRKVEA